MDPNIYEAALDLGASPTKALGKVLIPMLLPGIISGFVLSFTLSMDDFIITQINKGAATGINTLSTYIYEDARLKGLSPFWFAIFSIIFVVVLSLVLLMNFRKNAAEAAQKGGKK
jgi:spermidine/putrescine transport system permease protein